MRQIGQLNDRQQAEHFADHLRGSGRGCSVEPEGDGFALWIQDEDHLDWAREELRQFRENPCAPKFRDAADRAREKLDRDLARQTAARRNQVSMRDRWARPAASACPFTFALIAACVIVFYFTEIMGDKELLMQFFIGTRPSLPEVRAGEVWRLFTPILAHGSLLHILFNMMWLRDFGMILESRKGTPWFVTFVLFLALVSNLAQFLAGTLFFLGMSGVNYGLFGYLWVKGKLEPESGLGLAPNIVTLMLIWFVLCFTGLVGPIANAAHAGGLAAGAFIAAIPTILRRLGMR